MTSGHFYRLGPVTVSFRLGSQHSIGLWVIYLAVFLLRPELFSGRYVGSRFLPETSLTLSEVSKHQRPLPPSLPDQTSLPSIRKGLKIHVIVIHVICPILEDSEKSGKEVSRNSKKVTAW